VRPAPADGFVERLRLQRRSDGRGAGRRLFRGKKSQGAGVSRPP